MTATDLDISRGAPWADPLAAVRQALLSRATADAERIRSRAVADVSDRLAAAEVRAAEAAAASAGELDADLAVIAAEARSRARRQGREVVLAAQRAAYERLRAGSRSAVRELRDDPGYAQLLTRLTAVARDRLGPGAVVREHPSGGVVAEFAGRRLTLSLDAAAERAVEALGDEVEWLWTP